MEAKESRQIYLARINRVIDFVSEHLDEPLPLERLARWAHFSRAFRQVYGFSPRHESREHFLEESKIRQDLRANAGYGFGKLPDPRNPDRFRVHLVDHPARRVAYVRVVGGYVPDKILDGFDRLMAWGSRQELVPGAPLIGMSWDDPEITPMSK
jgi:hypothetical protein